jgi:hypothetical protein
MTWPTLLGLFLAATAAYGGWRLSIRFLESRRERINWHAVRIWWPTAMLVLGLFLSRQGSRVPELIGGIFGALNLPAVLLVVGVLGLLGDVPMWLAIVAGSVTMWGASYCTVRFVEWRAWWNAPTELTGLTPPLPRRPPQSSGP